MHVPPLAFFITKYFGSGVIVATAFIHVSYPASLRHYLNHSRITHADIWQLLAPAIEALTSPCLSGPITEYSWVEGIVLITIFMMLFIEMMAARSDVFGTHDHNHGDNLKKPEVDLEMNGMYTANGALLDLFTQPSLQTEVALFDHPSDYDSRFKIRVKGYRRPSEAGPTPPSPSPYNSRGRQP